MIGATYRLQFRAGITFDTAAALAPHLKAAGITHLYASPIFEAAKGSTHGYDVTDHTAFAQELGGAAGFARMSAALKAAGIGLILDIVPNHMAASPENPWWWDVLKHGEESRFAHHFDIDWTAQKLILPILGKPYGQALQDGDLALDGDTLTAPGHTLPLAPGTGEEGTAEGDVHTVHERQHYRLAHWRIGRDGLTYRRFFEITGLVGVRVEEGAVFDDLHALVRELTADGRVDGLRVDHVDGLTDPADTLKRLSAMGVPVFVEKILEGAEALPDGWPVDGTTGYEFIAALAALYTDEAGLAALNAAYAALGDPDLAAEVRAAKDTMVSHNLAAEVERLVALAKAALASNLFARDFGPGTLRDGVKALLTALPVYRTYVRPGETPSSVDAAIIKGMVEAARAQLEEPDVANALAGLFTAPGPAAAAFTARFQQTSGPVMAKAVEDTAFFRHHAALGLNEVGGGHDGPFGTGPLQKVGRETGLAATQTHDTKRGEDARARLYALTDPDLAARFAAIWPTMPGNIPQKLRWAFTQMLYASFDGSADFADRFAATALKTVREAKEETSWTAQNAPFEAAVEAAARQMVAEHHRLAPMEPGLRAGAIIGCGQALGKTFTRRTPDIYQGTFGWDFAMVDPDNRRPVDFEAEFGRLSRGTPLADLVAHWQTGAIKARCLHEGLLARGARPALFEDGDFAVDRVGPDGSVAVLTRTLGREAAVLALPVRPARDLSGEGLGVFLPEPLVLALPTAMRPVFAQDDQRLTAVDLAAAFAAFPVFFAVSWG
ncbi:MAG: malto-oligosyltrehalose synthase [Pseudomonadota bacterium]